LGSGIDQFGGGFGQGSRFGGSLRDVQHLAGYASLPTTQIYADLY
jgi:site-specific recombinase XerC